MKLKCKYCKGNAKSSKGLCSNCKEKADIIERIQAMLK